MKKHLLSLLFFLYTLTVYAQQPAAPAMQKFTAKDKSFEIGYPASWEINPTPPMGMSFLALSKAESDTDTFAENVNLFVQDLKGEKVTAEEYAIMSKPVIRKMATDYVEIDSKKLKLGERDAYMIIYTARQGEYVLKFNQVFLIEKGKGYVFTYTSQPSSYNKFIKTFGAMANSFKTF